MIIIIDFFDHTHHLMTQNDRQMRRWSTAFDLIKFGVAYATNCNTYKDLTSTNFWFGQGLE
jgi:hypothetical protein